MALTWGQKVAGFIKSPGDTFNQVEKEELSTGFKYYAVTLVIQTVLAAVVAVVALALLGGSGLGLALLFVSTLVLGYIVSLVGSFIGAAWMHIWVYLLGGRNGYKQTVKSLWYGSTPGLLLGWIPFVSIVTGIWTLVLFGLGLTRLHKMSTGRAVGAIIIGIVVPIVIIALIAGAVLLALLSGGSAFK